MKNYTLLLVLFFCLPLAGFSQNTTTISVFGHVYGNNTFQPVPLHLVTVDIYTTGVVQHYELYTDTAGAYQGTFTVLSAGYLIIATTDCEGVVHSFTTTFPSANIIYHVFYICPPASYPCTASFWYEIQPWVNVFPTVAFYDCSIGNPVQWLWDFGDGTTSTVQNPVHQYQTTGIYSVCLTIWDANGACQHTHCELINTNPWSNCTNWFWYEQTNPTTFQFFGEAYPAASLYFWDFGDGHTATGSCVTHSFDPSLGNVFTVTLTTIAIAPSVTDSCTAVTSMEVCLLNYPGDCSNWFTYEFISPLTVQFYGEAYPAASQYYWDFGDGTTATGQQVTHTYDPAMGYEFLVTLTTVALAPSVTDTCTATSYGQVWLNNTNICYNWFWYEQTSDSTLLFFAEAWPEADLYQWTLPDGSTVLGPEFALTINPAIGPEFEVCLDTYIIYNTGDTCHAQTCQVVCIGQGNYYNIQGTIFTGNVPADAAFAVLYGISSNGTASSMIVETIGNTGVFIFENVPVGNYYLIGYLSPASQHFSNYFPTYYGNVLNWYQSTMINPINPVISFNIHLIPVSGNGQGTGAVNGSVFNQLTSTPASGIQLTLMNMNYQPLSFTYTNELGEYSFGMLNYGWYRLKVELPGAVSQIAVFQINQSSTVATINFIITGTEVILGEERLPDNQVKVYPNPVSDVLFIEAGRFAGSPVAIDILNTMGHVVFNQIHEYQLYGNVISVPVRELNPGLYFLRITSESKSETYHFIKAW